MKKQLMKRATSILMAIAMLLTMVGVLPTANESVKADTTTTFTMHFDMGDADWEDVYVYLCEGSSWEEVSGYEYAHTWPGAEVAADAANDGWYSIAIDVAEGAELKIIFNSGEGEQTGNIEVTAGTDSEYWVTYAGHQTAPTTTETAPTGWTEGTYEAPLKPFVNVTLNVKDANDWGTMNVYAAIGDSWAAPEGYEAMNSWPGVAMEENEANDGWYTYSLQVRAGSKLNYVFNGNGSQTSDLNNVIGDEDTELWFDTSDSATTSSTTEPEGWETEPVAKSVFEMHFNPGTTAWDQVYAYICNSSWGALSGYAYAGSWPGAEVEADPENDGWYSFTLTLDQGTGMMIILNNNNGSQTGDLALTATNSSEEYWMTFGEDDAPTTTEPSGWVDSTSNPPVDPNANSTVVSPVVNEDGTVTVYLEDATGKYDSAVSVNLMGTLNGTDWGTGLAMTKNDEGVYTVTTPVQTPGVYQYKFKISYESGDPDWITDPMNKNDLLDGNSVVVVSGLAGTTLDAKRGVATELPTLKYYDEDGNASDVSVTYTVSDSDLAEDVTIADGKITVAEDSTVDTVGLQATDDNGNTATVTVNVVDAVYNYTIYYYDTIADHMVPENADVYMWNLDGGDLSPAEFTTLETLSDGKTWMKATFSTSATNFGFIPRSKGAWTWQTGDHTYNNTEKQENVTLYVIYGDDAHTYTELPEISDQRERYVMIEYNRTNNDYDGWNIYTWNSGFGSEVTIDPVKMDGKWYYIIPVKDSDQDFNLSFCMRRSEEDNAWAEKDGGDHSVTVPADQVVVKAVFDQGSGITEVYDYNTGYEMKAADDTISFYYRDDNAVVNGTHDNFIGKVYVVVNGTSHRMTYNEEQDRYEYDLTGCETGIYEYYYKVSGVKKLDAFNEETNADETASVLYYKKVADLGIVADVYYDTMDYNDNNVVSVSLPEDSAISMDEITKATVDLSELGLGTMDINLELMEVTIAASSTVSAGVKTLPVEVTDIYGNIYRAEATVTVTERDADDFDWDEAVIYMTCTDRFFDGSTSNNDGVDTDESLAYHGGDFAGLEEKLDYLESLGVNTIWITPIVENEDISSTNTGYHGYWASSFTELNSHLGTEEELESLIEALHARGMKLMVDVVINHAGYGTEDYFNSILDENMIRSAEQSIADDDIYSSLSGLPDFLTEDADVRAQLVAWQVDWMTKFDIDFYRIDTVKHVDTTTWSMFKNELTKANADFKIIGEAYGHSYSSDYLNSGTMDSVLDFDFNELAGDFVTGKLSSVESALENRNSALTNSATVGAFLSSHDEDSFVDKLISGGLTEDEALALAKVAASLQISAKGQTVIYYGEEIGQHGLNSDYPIQSNRSDFDWDEADEQAADDSSMLAHYTKLLAIRSDFKELIANGTRAEVSVSDEDGYDVFSRSYDGETLYFALNIKDTASTVTFKVAAEAGSQLEDLYSGTVYTVSESGEVTVTIPAASDGGTVVLYVAEDDDQDDDDQDDDDQDDDQNNNGNDNQNNNGNDNQNNTGNNNLNNNGNNNQNNNGNGNQNDVDSGATGDVTFPIMPVVVFVAGAGLALITMKKKYTVK
ncbi:MAG: starch-binding protein [Agathobacter sp.]|nr:starch-binding protein [Agathobacter sp.]